MVREADADDAALRRLDASLEGQSGDASALVNELVVSHLIEAKELPPVDLVLAPVPLEKLREDPAMVAAIEARTPLGRFAEPEEVSPGILYLASRASAMVTGHTLAIDGGWLAI